MARKTKPKPPPAGADAILRHTLQMVAANLKAAETEALVAAERAKKRGMRPDHIAAGLGWSRSTLYRRMEGRW